MAGRLRGKIALVLGAGSSSGEGGLSNGEAVALYFAREGASVVCADLRLEGAENICRRIQENGGIAHAIQCNVTRSDDIRHATSVAVERYGRLDILHNNVGTEQLGGPVETEEADWDRVHEVNLKSVFLAYKHAIPVMERQGGGSIINVSSTASFRWSGAEFIAYNSSKAAVNHITRIVARQYAGKHIRSNAIVPGYMDTPHIRTLYKHLDRAAFDEVMKQRDAKCPMGRQGTSADVANAAVFLASDEASYITGQLLVVDGGWTI